MRIIWSATAVANLAAIRDYTAPDKPEAARRLAAEILSCAELLKKHPHLGRPGREPDTRELILGGTPYIVCYEVRRSAVNILAVLHASQDKT